MNANDFDWHEVKKAVCEELPEHLGYSYSPLGKVCDLAPEIAENSREEADWFADMADKAAKWGMFLLIDPNGVVYAAALLDN